MTTYVCPEKGVEKPCRRSANRVVDNDLDRVFDGLRNMIRNVDPYQSGYLTKLAQTLGEVVERLGSCQKAADLESKYVVQVLEQDAIYDGEPQFAVDLGMLMYMLNYHSLGGTQQDLEEVRQNPAEFGVVDAARLKRYTTTLALYVKPHED
jgi:hypothetical protein